MLPRHIEIFADADAYFRRLCFEAATTIASRALISRRDAALRAASRQSATPCYELP